MARHFHRRSNLEQLATAMATSTPKTNKHYRTGSWSQTISDTHRHRLQPSSLDTLVHSLLITKTNKAYWRHLRTNFLFKESNIFSLQFKEAISQDPIAPPLGLSCTLPDVKRKVSDLHKIWDLQARHLNWVGETGQDEWFCFDSIRWWGSCGQKRPDVTFRTYRRFRQFKGGRCRRRYGTVAFDEVLDGLLEQVEIFDEVGEGV